VSEPHHAVVWLDHSEAKVFRFGADEESEVDMHSHTSLQRLHHGRDGWEAGGNPPDAASRVFAVESEDQPAADILLALGRRFFSA